MASSVAEAPVPEEPNGEHGTNGLKRRHSDASQEENKKQRTSPGKSSPTAIEEQPAKEADNTTTAAEKPAETREARRKGGAADEKQRSKRLFGALLGNLNRPSDRVSKRRTEIEQRRKAELQKQDDERLEDRQRRLEKLALRRKREQIRVDEESMRARHDKMLNAANFLQTNAEPKLYYRPWELLPDEEDRIDDQIRDVKVQIEEEVAEFETEKQKRLNELDDKKPEEAAPVTGSVDQAAEKVAPSAEVFEAQQLNEEVAQTQPAESTNTIETPAVAEITDPVDDKVAEGEAGQNPDSTVPDRVEIPESLEPVAQEERKEEVEEEGGHVVIGDEDTVEY